MRVSNLVLAGVFVAACSGNTAGQRGVTISIDGSSTVFLITQAVAEEFQHRHRGRVTVGISGTGGGFKKFCRGETAITGASRPISPREIAACRKQNIEFIELPVAFDGIAVVVHKDNDWVDAITVAELKAMWEPAAAGKLTSWDKIRAGWPDRSLHLFGPGVDSGTYDYFTKAIVGREHASRGDFTSSEDDNVLVQGVATDRSALGFFGFAYYVENADKLKLLAIDDGEADNGAGAIAPSIETVANGTYQPLSRPIFIYVSKRAAAREEVSSFVHFYLSEGRELVKEVGYVPLTGQIYDLARRRFAALTGGTIYAGGAQVGVSLEEMLGRD